MKPLTLLCPLALFACTTEFTDTTPPTVAEPRAGQVFDRCEIRIRMTQPGLDAVSNSNTGIGVHAAWRVNGGVEHEIWSRIFDTHIDESFLFAVTLVPGANHLELGRCDAAGSCGWTAVDVRADLHAGSPDCMFAGAGQHVFAHADERVGPAILTDGRPVYGTWLPTGGTTLAGAVYALSPEDGNPDPTFGVAGVVTTPRSGLVRPVALANGGFVIMHVGGTGSDVSYLSRYDRNGVLDTAFGDTGVVLLVDPQSSASLRVFDTRPEADGSTLIAGATFVARIDPTGTQMTFTRFDPGQTDATAAALDANGNVAVLFRNIIVKAALGTGIDTAFGTGGTLTLPSGELSVGEIRFHAGGIAVANPIGNAPGGVQLMLVTAAGTVTPVSLSFDSAATMNPSDRTAHLASAADGSLYVASTMAHPALPTAESYIDVPEEGTDITVVRIRNGAVDASFGSNGYAKTSFMLSWKDISYETLYDMPTSLTVGPDGAPWFIGRSLSTTMASMDPQFRRGPGLAIAKLMP